jgi:FG-GAP-like repeat
LVGSGDGRSGLLWQGNDGKLGVWLMNGTRPIAEAGVGNHGANWKVIGTADYNADGHDDILYQSMPTA